MVGVKKFNFLLNSPFEGGKGDVLCENLGFDSAQPDRSDKNMSFVILSTVEVCYKIFIKFIYSDRK
ncbi:hypothetical protein CAPN004_06420 [Capnocytophaga cynodegmi]|nr:hypothetical protein CAPN004_06420 [Capnocytophaga cynodegmi]